MIVLILALVAALVVSIAMVVRRGRMLKIYALALDRLREQDFDSRRGLMEFQLEQAELIFQVRKGHDLVAEELTDEEIAYLRESLRLPPKEESS